METKLKERYEVPKIYVEEFTPNHAIASCDEPMAVTFQCLQGPNVDKTNVLSLAYNGTTCSNNAGYADGILTAINSSGRGSSSISSSSSWSWTSSSKTATYTGDADGILYICMPQGNGSGSTSHWTVGTSAITHSSNNSNEHVQVAAVGPGLQVVS